MKATFTSTYLCPWLGTFILTYTTQMHGLVKTQISKFWDSHVMWTWRNYTWPAVTKAPILIGASSLERCLFIKCSEALEADNRQPV